jgi:predicted NUDIX family NTP pyrophosphohydrolase
MKAKLTNISAGLLLYRQSKGDLEVLLAHPGGPFWTERDVGAWTIPKGLINDGEEPLAAACREFEEETGIAPKGHFHSLGNVRQKAGKIVYAWALEGDADIANLRSNFMQAEVPRGSGKWMSFPEIDRYGWFNPVMARLKLNPAQVEFIDRLEEYLLSESPSSTDNGLSA